MPLRYFPRRIINPDPTEDDDGQLPRMLAFRRRISAFNYSHLQVAQIRDYVVLAPPTGAAVAQIRQYVVLEPPAALSVAQMRVYIVLITVPPQAGTPFGQWRRAMQDDGDGPVTGLVLERREAVTTTPTPTAAPGRRTPADDDADAGQMLWLRGRRQATAPATPAPPPTAPSPFLAMLRTTIGDEDPPARRQAFFAPPPTPATSWPPFVRFLWSQQDDEAPPWRRQAPSLAPVQQAAVPTAPSPWWAAVGRQADDDVGRPRRPGPFNPPPPTPPSIGTLPFLFVIA